MCESEGHENNFLTRFVDITLQIEMGYPPSAQAVKFDGQEVLGRS